MGGFLERLGGVGGGGKKARAAATEILTIKQ
jgi:hypothetical protein